ncbi:RNA polymerase sigma factor [Sinanaerobacter chloroacetimidivorans]|jgi:RNA polymerase sigma factor (sigma-70 family)|uniref:Sigma-70 family RNA polymerase sigma factor n=1 Tax=Sinanaerobacter chloroacetimidivorans TaxID=2818044 RepID=A0A8J7VZZ0_9FIRM|nr:sigma-70 family RNA polymerase sigma factor [Sinanaerobacter chloroacetimidivorans]MBR0596703.1 sigma-70 family RNA polymerase sigma factor [Sinanaerobacter chloroacetimidivorans]
MLEDQREKQLIKKAKSGDESSFESLILGCQNRAYNIAYRYLKNEEDAMDALQESFIKIFRHLHKFKEDSRFDTWVYRIVVNTCNDMLRKNNNRKTTDSIYKVEDDKETIMEIPDNTSAPEEVYEKKEKSNEILSGLDKLSIDQKEIVILRDVQGFSYEEISDILDCSIGTVKSRLNRARLRLREILLEQN